MDFVVISKKDNYDCCTGYGVFSSENEPVQHVISFLCLSINQKRNPISYEFQKYNKRVISVGVFLVLRAG